MTEFQPKIHYNRAYEAAILGCCLLVPSAYERTRLKPEMFYADDHQTVYRSLGAMSAANIPIDLLTATDFMERRQPITLLCGSNIDYFLCKLTNDVVFDTHLKYWCEAVRDMWKLRMALNATPQTVAQVAAAIGNPQDNRRRNMRFLLRYVDKSTIRDNLDKWGAKLIAGHTSHRIGVDSAILVFLMSIVEPQYTWSCIGHSDERLTNDQCRTRLPENALFVDGNWIDKTNQYPVEWR